MFSLRKSSGLINYYGAECLGTAAPHHYHASPHRSRPLLSSCKVAQVAQYSPLGRGMAVNGIILTSRFILVALQGCGLASAQQLDCVFISSQVCGPLSVQQLDNFGERREGASTLVVEDVN